MHRLKSPQARGRDRPRRQVRRARRVVQEPQRGADPRRHRATTAASNLHHIDSEEIEKRGAPRCSADMDGILVAPGFGSRGTEGKIAAVRYAREKRRAVLRHLPRHADGGASSSRATCAGSSGANSTEIDPATPHPVVDLMPEQRGVTDKGATMRLGAYPCVLTPGTRAAAAYGATEISERHRHRYEVNNDYRDALIGHGMVISGAVARRPAGRDDRAARSTRTSSAASSTPSSSRGRRRRTRCSSRSSRPRSRARLGDRRRRQADSRRAAAPRQQQVAVATLRNELTAVDAAPGVVCATGCCAIRVPHDAYCALVGFATH